MMSKSHHKTTNMKNQNNMPPPKCRIPIEIFPEKSNLDDTQSFQSRIINYYKYVQGTKRNYD